jgi:homoserine dehydrogenase
MSFEIIEKTNRKPLSAKRTIRIGLCGFGVVGSGVVNIIRAKNSEFEERFGVSLEIAGICVRDLQKERAVAVDPAIVTDNIATLLADDTLDVIIEVIGGRFEAQTLIEEALRSRKHVITANKLVLAHELPRLRSIAHRNGVNLFYSASVCGSVPVLNRLDELKVSDTIAKITGIVNGSTNFILTMMSEENVSYEDAVAEARVRGFLEADPSLDVSGADAAQKLSVLVYHAFGEHLPPHAIRTSGIEAITTRDFAEAKSEGKTIKLLASAERIGHNIRAAVRPERVPLTHLFAHTRDEFNALEIETRHAGPQVLYGKGAGSLPTASAVVSDLIELLKEE